MKTPKPSFQITETLHKLRHYLPSQSILKDFIHHNTLHAFQHDEFFTALSRATQMFGYKTRLSLDEYRKLFNYGKISLSSLQRSINRRAGNANTDLWESLLLEDLVQQPSTQKIGRLRDQFKSNFHINLDKEVHPILFRLLGNFLDQGIAIRPFPVENKEFLPALRELFTNSLTPFFRSKRVQSMFLNDEPCISTLLAMLISDERFFEQYLFDQQFSHPGWSGMVAVLEANPETLLNEKIIHLKDLIYLELLLEIDAIDAKHGENWLTLKPELNENEDLFAPTPVSLHDEALSIWQEAFEWSYYDQVLSGIDLAEHGNKDNLQAGFDAVFCIDDRECSLRRYIEQTDPKSRTWGTPGFFNVPFYFQPEHSRFYSKVCPAPLTPKHIIKEYQTKKDIQRDVHFGKQSHSVIFGWLISQTLGFWSAFKLFFNIFKPGISPATSYSFNHMDKAAQLTIENRFPDDTHQGLQIGFTIDEMTNCVEGLLMSMGLVSHFSNLIYIVGHGASSINNTHYAGYDCGACSGRPGSVNARVISYMANHGEVRRKLKDRGIDIPEHTRFVGAMHDTTRDEIEFYDEAALPEQLLTAHLNNVQTFKTALDLNAKERSRRFLFTDSSLSPEKVHEKVKLRSVSLFEPRPELNHATNTLCIVGRRGLTDHLFLDRRAFLNSYDYNNDPEGKYLFNILKAATPVCGGINLEYYFSRVDNQRLGAGTKLPHNVMGLISVANGADGDLRTGLPWQMVEVHDPLRLLIIVEQKPDIVHRVISQNVETYEWYQNGWVNLVVLDPDSGQFFRFNKNAFEWYTPIETTLPTCRNISSLIETETENIPVQLLKPIAV